MSAKHWKDSDRVVHCDTSDGVDYTLCGEALEGERGDTPMTETFEGIDCPRCIDIIRFCQKVRPGEIKMPSERRRRA